jgi:hypothetical protein
MNGEPRSVAVKIGKLTLRLSPLERKDLAAANDTIRRLKAWLDRPLSEEFLGAIGDALGFVFVSSRRNHAGLSLAELHDEAELQEIVFAFEKLSEVTREHWCEERGNG